MIIQPHMKPISAGLKSLNASPQAIKSGCQITPLKRDTVTFKSTQYEPKDDDIIAHKDPIKLAFQITGLDKPKRDYILDLYATKVGEKIGKIAEQATRQIGKTRDKQFEDLEINTTVLAHSLDAVQKLGFDEIIQDVRLTYHAMAMQEYLETIRNCGVEPNSPYTYDPTCVKIGNAAKAANETQETNPEKYKEERQKLFEEELNYHLQEIISPHYYAERSDTLRRGMRSLSRLLDAPASDIIKDPMGIKYIGLQGLGSLLLMKDVTIPEKPKI